MTKIATNTYTLPAYWASYLVNGDASGITDDERAEIDAFCEGLGTCSGTTDEPEYFQRHNDANRVGGNVLDFIFFTVL